MIVCCIQVEKPRFYAVGDDATYVKYNVDPQEEAMIRGNIDDSVEDEKWHGTLTFSAAIEKETGVKQQRIPTVQGRWRNFYENVYDVLCNNGTPAISYESVIRTMTVMNAAIRSGQTGQAIIFPTEQ